MAGRRKGLAYGAHRVLEPQGALPQGALRLDASLPIYDNEVLIEVRTLNLDSASFHQMSGEVSKQHADPSSIGQALGQMLLDQVAKRGKQVNAVTGSGGMLIGTVSEVGPAYEGPCRCKVGDRLATLVSLTLTPLHLQQVVKVHLEGKREAQVDVKGHAILFSGAPAAVLPDDLPEETVLSVLDVCGAPAQVARLAKPQQTVLVIGAGGKSGLLCLTQARKVLGKSGLLLALDYSEPALAAIKRLGVADQVAKVDARDALQVSHWVETWTKGKLADLVFNTTNVAHTEMAGILSVRNQGSVYFFNMATDFARAALGAEGVGKDVSLYIGNGFTPGHAALALDLVRENQLLLELLQ